MSRTPNGSFPFTGGRTVVALLICLLCAAIPVRAQPVDEQAALTFISRLSDEVVAILGSDSGNIEQREQRVRELMDTHVHIDFIARFSLGKYWPRASQEERSDYTAVFRQFFLQKYAGMLGGYRDQVVSVDGVKTTGESDFLVDTRVYDGKGGPPVNASWRVREFEGRPRIVDIVIEGISMAMNQRQEFASVLQRGGIGGLVDVLRATTERIPAQAPA